MSQIFESNFQRNRRMEDAGMSDNPEEFVNARPGNCPRQRSFGKSLQEFKRRTMALARFDFSINEDVCVDGLHGLAPIHQVKQRVAIQQVNPRKFNGFPSPKTQLVRFLRAGAQRAAKKIIRHRLECTTLFGGFLFQFKKKLIIDRQSGSFHMQKHIMLASRCQTRTNTE